MVTQQEIYLTQVRDLANTTLDVLLANVASSIGTGSNTANTALTAVGAAYGQANAAYAQANAARSQANTAYLQANNAYAAANAANAASGVTPGVYGSTIQIPVLNIDVRGRIIAPSNNQTIQTFGPAQAGVVPPSGGGNTNVLFANGVWTTPPTSGAPVFIDPISVEGTMGSPVAADFTWRNYNTVGHGLPANIKTVLLEAHLWMIQQPTGVDYTPAHVGYVLIRDDTSKGLTTSWPVNDTWVLAASQLLTGGGVQIAASGRGEFPVRQSPEGGFVTGSFDYASPLPTSGLSAIHRLCIRLIGYTL